MKDYSNKNNRILFVVSKNIFSNNSLEKYLYCRHVFKINNQLATKFIPSSDRNKSRTNIQISLCRRRKRIIDSIC